MGQDVRWNDFIVNRESGVVVRRVAPVYLEGDFIRAAEQEGGVRHNKLSFI